MTLRTDLYLLKTCFALESPTAVYIEAIESSLVRSSLSCVSESTSSICCLDHFQETSSYDRLSSNFLPSITRVSNLCITLLAGDMRSQR
jgi:hypothetical protein